MRTVVRAIACLACACLAHRAIKTSETGRHIQNIGGQGVRRSQRHVDGEAIAVSTPSCGHLDSSPLKALAMLALSGYSPAVGWSTLGARLIIGLGGAHEAREKARTRRIRPRRMRPIFLSEGDDSAEDESTDGAADAARLRLEAERARLQAERAQLELELEIAQLQAEGLLANTTVEVDATPSVSTSSFAVEATGDSDAAREALRLNEKPMSLRSPLKYIGTYPAVAFSFPELQTIAMKERMEAGDESAKGVTLDFIMDTAANTNTINAALAGPFPVGLNLTQVGTDAGGLSTAGTMGGAPTYMLGKVEFADVPPEERVVFMSDLTASALPVPSPGAAGILGISFLNSFAGGALFKWGWVAGVPETSENLPSLTLFGDEDGTLALRSREEAIPITPLNGTGLPSVRIRINGVEMPALLDTGSPITVLNAAAAKVASVIYDKALVAPPEESKNPFARMGDAFKAQKEASSGKVLMIMGVNGPVKLAKVDDVKVELGSVSFGDDCAPYVGDIPGLAALDGLGADAGPAVVLGIDVLRRRPRMWYTATNIYI